MTRRFSPTFSQKLAEILQNSEKTSNFLLNCNKVAQKARFRHIWSHCGPTASAAGNWKKEEPDNLGPQLLAGVLCFHQLQLVLLPFLDDLLQLLPQLIQRRLVLLTFLKKQKWRLKINQKQIHFFRAQTELELRMLSPESLLLFFIH